jgi:2-methylisocitrate lyase-like PEP mutase family enzyme
LKPAIEKLVAFAEAGADCLYSPGVRRVSVGGALARVMWSAVVATASELKEGRFDSLASGTPGSTLNEIVASAETTDARRGR